MTPPRWRVALACFCLRASCSLSWRFCSARRFFSASLRRLSSARRSAREDFGASGVSSSPSGAPGDVAGDRNLGVVLSPRLADQRIGSRAFLFLRFASATLGLALCAGLCHRRLPGLLVRRVVTAPAAELAQLDTIRRVAPGLVGLVVAPLAFLASQRHRDADISASHFSSFAYGRPLQRKTPGRGARLNRRIAVERIAGVLRVRGSWR
jgi:hypothetical protein